MILAANMLLALLWVALTMSFTLGNFVLGFVIGYGLLVVFSGVRRPGYARRMWAGFNLAIFAVWELVLANLRVAWHTVTTLKNLRPAVLGIPLREDLSDGEITLLANLITLTPGTLSLDISKDRSTLYVHFIHIDDADEAIRNIQEGFERRVLEVTR